jgi:hypothetical protein
MMARDREVFAYPVSDGQSVQHGMTLRDWFAGQVLASAAALPYSAGDYQFRAKVAYEQADAMLAARAAS